MMIYLLRHGIAEQKGLSDAARELSREGVMQTRAMAEKFKLHEPQVDKALMSPFQRARQTASLLRVVFPSLRFEVERALEPEADVYALFEKLETYNVQNLLLVSHNPLLSKLLSIMLDATLETARPFEPSHLYCIEMDFVAPGCGTLKYVLQT